MRMRGNTAEDICRRMRDTHQAGALLERKGGVIKGSADLMEVTCQEQAGHVLAQHPPLAPGEWVGLSRPCACAA